MITETEHWLGFMITQADRIEVFDPSGEMLDLVHEKGMFEKLLLAGYPAGPVMLDVEDIEPIIDLSLDPTIEAPEITAYLTHKDPAQRELKMGEASAVFLEWYRRWENA